MGYFGPAFSGIKKDFNAKSLVKPDITSVLEIGLNKFNRGKIKKVVAEIRTASRTDIGVHAVRNVFTFNTTVENLSSKLLHIDDLKKGFN
jgi:tRNA pseudouridine(38-40) synthase